MRNTKVRNHLNMESKGVFVHELLLGVLLPQTLRWCYQSTHTYHDAFHARPFQKSILKLPGEPCYCPGWRLVWTWPAQSRTRKIAMSLFTYKIRAVLLLFLWCSSRKEKRDLAEQKLGSSAHSPALLHCRPQGAFLPSKRKVPWGRDLRSSSQTFARPFFPLPFFRYQLDEMRKSTKYIKFRSFEWLPSNYIRLCIDARNLKFSEWLLYSYF